MSAFTTQIVPYESDTFTKSDLRPEIYDAPLAEPTLTENEITQTKEEILYNVLPYTDEEKASLTIDYMKKVETDTSNGGGEVLEVLDVPEPTLVKTVKSELQQMNERVIVPLESKINIVPIAIGLAVAYFYFRR